MFPLSSLLLTVAQNLDFLKTPPTATIAVLILSAGISLISSYVNRRAVNLDDYKKMMIESQRVQKQVMVAIKSGNQRQIDKAQKRQQELMSQQSKMTMNRMMGATCAFLSNLRTGRGILSIITLDELKPLLLAEPDGVVQVNRDPSLPEE